MPKGTLLTTADRLRLLPRSPHAVDWGGLLPHRRRNGGRNKVAIVCATASRATAPLEDPTTEVWSCNSLWACGTDRRGRFRADRWFELHPLDAQTPDELAAMHACPAPLYVVDDATADEAEHWLPYPLAHVEAAFPGPPYWACTMAYQIALAIVEEFETISLHGMALGEGTARERLVELACVAYWLGVARGVGLALEVPDGPREPLWHPGRYGIEYRKEADAVRDLVDDFRLNFVVL